MPTVPAAIQTALDSRSTTLATCWYAKMRDGTELGFTEHDQDITYYNADISPNTIVYQANTGALASERENSADLAVDNSELSTPLKSGGLTFDAAERGDYDGMTIKIFMIDWRTPSNGIIKMQHGILGELKRDNELFMAELRSLAQLYNTRTGKRIMPVCDAVFGDSNCKFSAEALIDTASITAVIDERTFTIAHSGSNYPNKYTNGLVDFTSGEMAGKKFDVQTFDYATNIIKLQETPPKPIQIGDTFNIHVGCDKTFATCRDIFKNHFNFQGFPYVPTGDTIYKISIGDQPLQASVSGSSEFDGGLLGEYTSAGFQREFSATDYQVDPASGITLQLPNNYKTVAQTVGLPLSTLIVEGVSEFLPTDSDITLSYNVEGPLNVGAKLSNYKNTGKYIIGIGFNNYSSKQVKVKPTISVVSASGNNHWRTGSILKTGDVLEVWNSVAYTDSPNIGMSYYMNETESAKLSILLDLDANKIFIKDHYRGWWNDETPFVAGSGIALNMASRNEPVTVAVMPFVSDLDGVFVASMYQTGYAFNLTQDELRELALLGYTGWDLS